MRAKDIGGFLLFGMRSVRARTLQSCKAFVALVLPVMILVHAQDRGTTGMKHHNGHFYLKREISRLRAKLNAAEDAIDSLERQLQHCRRSVQGVAESQYLALLPTRPQAQVFAQG